MLPPCATEGPRCGPDQEEELDQAVLQGPLDRSQDRAAVTAPRTMLSNGALVEASDVVSSHMEGRLSRDFELHNWIGGKTFKILSGR